MLLRDTGTENFYAATPLIRNYLDNDRTTEIELADGTKLPIEKIAVGQKVRSGEHGETLTVMDVTEGSERKPLVHVIDDKGNTLNMTDTHAVPEASPQIFREFT